MPAGTTYGAKQFTVAFVNNFQHIAENIGRMPTPELCAFLKREGVVQHKVAKFRPLKVDAAIDFLLENNVIYAEEDQQETPPSSPPKKVKAPRVVAATAARATTSGNNNKKRKLIVVSDAEDDEETHKTTPVKNRKAPIGGSAAATNGNRKGDKMNKATKTVEYEEEEEDHEPTAAEVIANVTTLKEAMENGEGMVFIAINNKDGVASNKNSQSNCLRVKGSDHEGTTVVITAWDKDVTKVCFVGNEYINNIFIYRLHTNLLTINK